MPNVEQEDHHKVGLGETSRRLIRKRRQYSSLDKFDDAFNTALDLMQKTKRSTTNGKEGKLQETQQSTDALVVLVS